jgi:putative N6-adenine-specific DNA methylase
MREEVKKSWSCALIVTPGLEEAALLELSYWCPRLATAFGLGADLSLNVTTADHGVLEFQAPLVFASALNHVLKVPTRILLRFASFRCRDFPKLFNKIRKIDWSQFTSAGEINWEVSATRSRLAVERRIEVTCKDGLAAYIKQKKTNPGSELPNTPQTIYVRMADDQCTISIDTSGGFLFKRGIRILVEEAPMRETIAASIIWWAIKQANLKGTDRRISLWDPMTGAGCIPLEAAGLLLPNCWVQYPFYSWPLFQRSILQGELTDIRKYTDIIQSTAGQSWFSQAVGSDISAKAVASAKANFENFEKLHGKNRSIPVKFFEMDLLMANSHTEINCPEWCIINPPYNERLSTGTSPGEFYRRSLQQLSLVESVKLIGIMVPGAHSSQITAPPGFGRIPGLRFKNGGIPIEFIIFLRVHS